jgi:hypothetical protein
VADIIELHTRILIKLMNGGKRTRGKPEARPVATESKQLSSPEPIPTLIQVVDIRQPFKFITGRKRFLQVSGMRLFQSPVIFLFYYTVS